MIEAAGLCVWVKQRLPIIMQAGVAAKDLRRWCGPLNSDSRDDMSTGPRILFTCGREAKYVRNLLIRRALRQQFDVFEVTDDTPGSLLWRHLRLLPRLLRALRRQHDLVFVGFYG